MYFSDHKLLVMVVFIFQVLLLMGSMINGDLGLQRQPTIFDYSIQKVDESINEYKDENSYSGSTLTHHLINPAVRVRLNRHDMDRSEVRFQVDTKIRITNDGPITHECNGRPGIWASLKLKRNSFGRRVSFDMTSVVRAFCYHSMNFGIQIFGSHAQLRVVFYEYNSNQMLTLIMHPFKPPKTEAEVAHAEKNQVLRIKSPISVEQFSRYLSRRRRSEQFFIDDILWLEEVLKQAKLEIGKETAFDEHSTYFAGPVIIEQIAYNKLLGLKKSFKKYNS